MSDAYQKIKFSESTFKVIDKNLKIYDTLKDSKKVDYKKNILINNLNFKYKINKVIKRYKSFYNRKRQNRNIWRVWIGKKHSFEFVVRIFRGRKYQFDKK